MKALERILWILAALAFVMKALHLPMSSLLLVVSLSLLGMLYLFLAWLVFPSPTRRDQLVLLSVLGGFVMSLATMGILFKLLFWPFRAFYLLLAVMGLAVLLISLFIIRSTRPDLSRYSRGMLFRAVPLLVACGALLALSDARLTAFYYRDDPELKPYAVQRALSTDIEESRRLTQQMDSIELARRLRPF